MPTFKSAPREGVITDHKVVSIDFLFLSALLWELGSLCWDCSIRVGAFQSTLEVALLSYIANNVYVTMP